ncbi:MAG: sigma-70 family RNA polymerase sigma factor [Planctomycetes bacterium]|nr:sigma-70 family RNA polymerase sigma factor [Planctomycetota bacterium]MBL7007431.1 sigma-70 family RNA polymerase sigma factor [Planctomycetota bacterium]
MGGRPRPDGRLESLFRDYGPRVYGLALRCGLDPLEAEDGVQEVFLKVQRRLDTFRGEAKLSTWLYQVALNTLLDHRRKLVRQKRMQPFAVVTDERGEVAAVDPGAGPDEQSSAAERRQLVRSALDRLPRKFKEVLVLRELEGLSYRDIARILGTAQGTVESRIFRGRARLGVELRRLEEGL